MYEHYIALDWAQSNMAIARMTKKSDVIKSMDVPSDLGNLKDYLKSLKGSKILTFEETTTAQWLYTELHSLVDEVCICDPYRNKLLSEGAKTDLIDASKLVQLLRANLLKPVFHSNDQLIELRKIISSYDDLVQRGVRLKNQRSALFRACGLDKRRKELDGMYESFILNKIDSAITSYESDKSDYLKKFEAISKKNKVVKNLQGIPGIGLIGAVKIAGIVITAKRFESNKNFLSYCGVVRLQKLSGGKSYGSRVPRHRRDLKVVFKTAALSCISHENEFRDYYEYLIREKNYPTYQARHAVARKIAIAAKGVMNSKSKYKPEKIGALREIKI